MKPIVIYNLPRTRSNATLEAAKRTKKIFEPFNVMSLYDINYHSEIPNLSRHSYRRLYQQTAKKTQDIYPSYFLSLAPDKIKEIFDDLNKPDTASKIHSFMLMDFLPARSWWEQIDNSRSHEIFVLVRDLHETLFSMILAKQYGYAKAYEFIDEPFTVPDDMFRQLRYNVDSFLRFMPKNASIIEFDNLPEEYFDRSKIVIENQNSLQHINKIKNLDYCEYQVNALIKYYQPLWDDAMSKLSRS